MHGCTCLSGSLVFAHNVGLIMACLKCFPKISTVKNLDSKILLHGKNKKEKMYVGSNSAKLVTSTLSTFVTEVIYSCTVQMIWVLTIVQVRD